MSKFKMEQKVNKNWCGDHSIDTAMHKKYFIYSVCEMNINFKLKLSQSQSLKYSFSCVLNFCQPTVSS